MERRQRRDSTYDPVSQINVDSRLNNAFRVDWPGGGEGRAGSSTIRAVANAAPDCCCMETKLNPTQ